MPSTDERIWFVYAIQSLQVRPGGKPGFFYVGCTTNPARRLRQHNGELVGGSRWTSQHRPLVPRALYGPYIGQSEALKAERALKRGKRGTGRMAWTPEDSKWCRGLGPDHPWVRAPLLPVEEFPEALPIASTPEVLPSAG